MNKNDKNDLCFFFNILYKNDFDITKKVMFCNLFTNNLF